jgi:hypothetical protein
MKQAPVVASLSLAILACDAALAQEPSTSDEAQPVLFQEAGIVDPDGDPRTPLLNAANVTAANQLLAQLQTETRDDAWAEPMEAAIVEGVAALVGADASILVLECRTTLCRLQLEFTDLGYHGMIGGELHRHLPEDFGEMWFYLDSESPPRSTFWIARGGVPLSDHWTE